MASCSNQKNSFLANSYYLVLNPKHVCYIHGSSTDCLFSCIHFSRLSLYFYTTSKKISHKTPLLIHDSETSIPIIHSTLRRKMTMRDLTTLTIIFSRPFIGGAMSFDSNFSLLFSCFEYGKC